MSTLPNSVPLTIGTVNAEAEFVIQGQLNPLIKSQGLDQNAEFVSTQLLPALLLFGKDIYV